MTSRCESCQEALVQAAGRTGNLPSGVAEHLAGCADCQAVAAAEIGLARLLELGIPVEDPRLIEAISAAVPRPSGRWRVLALLPVAASLMIALVGAVLLGGVPGGSLLAALPSASAKSVMTLSRALGDWTVAMSAVLHTAGTGLSQVVIWGALILTCLGLGLAGVMVRRWRRAVVRW